MYTTVAHNTAQNNSDNLPSYPPHNYHCSNVVYWRGEGNTALDMLLITTTVLLAYSWHVCTDKTCMQTHLADNNMKKFSMSQGHTGLERMKKDNLEATS